MSVWFFCLWFAWFCFLEKYILTYSKLNFQNTTKHTIYQNIYNFKSYCKQTTVGIYQCMLIVLKPHNQKGESSITFNMVTGRTATFLQWLCLENTCIGSLLYWYIIQPAFGTNVQFRNWYIKSVLMFELYKYAWM